MARSPRWPVPRRRGRPVVHVEPVGRQRRVLRRRVGLGRQRLAEETQQVPGEKGLEALVLPAAGLQRRDRCAESSGPVSPSIVAPTSSPGGNRPSGGNGFGISAWSRFVQSDPRQTRSGPIRSTACSRWSITRSIVAPLRVDRDRVQHQPEDPVAVGECPKLLVRDVARMVVDARHPACVMQTRPSYVCEALVEELRRRVRQIEHDLALGEHGKQRAAEPREPALIRGAVGVRVPPVPRQPRHAQPSSQKTSAPQSS